jgi:hypothetical protein
MTWPPDSIFKNKNKIKTTKQGQENGGRIKLFFENKD